MPIDIQPITITVIVDKSNSMIPIWYHAVNFNNYDEEHFMNGVNIKDIYSMIMLVTKKLKSKDMTITNLADILNAKAKESVLSIKFSVESNKEVSPNKNIQVYSTND